MAMPTWACASAGASLMPSPAMATTRPAACRRFTCSAFSAGSTSATISVIPSARPTASAVARVSPVSMTIRTPSARRRASASAADALTGSAMPISPSTWPARATWTTVCPSAASACARADQAAAARTADVVHQPRVAGRDRLAVDGAGHAPPGDRAHVARRPESSGRAPARARRSRRPADARWRARAPRTAAGARPRRRRRRRRSRPRAACPRSACRSCRSPACRRAGAAPAPRRS